MFFYFPRTIPIQAPHHRAQVPHRLAENTLQEVRASNQQQDDEFVESLSDEYRTKRCKWFRILRKFDVKLTAIENGILLCTCSLVFHFNYIFNRKDNDIKTIVALLWYVGVVFGCMICGLYRHTWPSRMPNLIMSTLLMISGIMRCFNESIWNQANIVIPPAQFIAGSCYGFAYIITVTHIGDNVWKVRRGHAGISLILPTLLACIVVSIIGAYYSAQDLDISEIIGKKGHSYETIMNMFGVLLVVKTFVFILITKFEPITRSLKYDNVEKARRVFTELNCGVLNSNAIDKEIEDKVKMMSEDYSHSPDCLFWGLFTKGNWKPLFLMLLLRVLNVWTSNIFVFQFFPIFFGDFHDLFLVPVIIGLRLLALLPAKYSIDKFGRKYFLLISGIGTGLSSIPLSLFSYWNIGRNPVKYAYILMNIFASMGIEPVTHIYAIEAFPLSKRNASIGFITSIEYIAHGLILVLMYEYFLNTLKVLTTVTPFLVICVTIMLFIMLPETKGKTIRECRAAFNDFYKQME